ncbi:hypothetical protein Tsubulata_004495 [Turnera subulata]|uniref:KIB1-4 beta-propeller domain-containing protein n=1 Tax=Turnera subulata TaxID=218843 RepID=A0A9Q0J006_9ROSI|nr:hypothetical protein Tsubulata_004495 [Turnera subulata]
MVMAYSSSYSLLRYSSCLRNLQNKTCKYHLLSNNNIIRKRTTAAASSCYSSLSSFPNPSGLSSSDEKPIVSQFPLLVFPSGSPYDPKRELNRNASFRFFNPATNQFTAGQVTSPLQKITESAAYPVFSNRGWLTYLDFTDCSPFLVNALSPSPSQEDIITLPSFKTFKPFTTEQIEEIRECPDTVPHEAGKIALSSSPTEDNCVVMLWLGDLRLDPGSLKFARSEFAFCRIGDTRWTFLDREEIQDSKDRFEIGDIIYSNKDRLFYAELNGKLVAFDLNNTSSPVSFKCPIKYPGEYHSEFEKDVYANAPWSTSYLVESPQGDLLMIERFYPCLDKDGRIMEHKYADYIKFPYRSVYFNVYKLDVEKQTAEHFNLEDMAVFVGKNQSFCVSVGDYPGLSPNSIYFTDDHSQVMHPNFGCSHGGHDNGVYNVLTQSVSPLFQPFGFKKIRPAPMWVSMPQ